MAAAPPVDYSRLKLFCILEGPGAAVLTFILQHGTHVPNPPMSIKQYLNSLPQTSTANYRQLSNREKKKAFTSTEKKQSDDLSWDRFDVSFLYKVISLACEDLAPLTDTAAWGDTARLEGRLKEIKDERNIFIHERPPLTPNEFETKVRELKNLFVRVLEAAQTRYGIPLQEITDEKRRVEDGVQHILGCFTIKEILRLDIIRQVPVFKKMTVNRLISMYEREQIFDPLCFLSGSSQKPVHIQNIFSKIYMKDKLGSGEIPYLKILGFTQSLGQPTQPPHSTQAIHPQLLLINGVAGSGKTTLLTFILSEWLKDECDRHMEHLDGYDFVLHILCRETNSASLKEFLEQVLPEAVMFRPSTITLLKACNVLFLIDGLDERNSSSRQLVKDILGHCKEVPGFSLICTSRPEAVVDFVVSAPTEYGKGEVMMEGISPDERTEFVLKYYNCLGAAGSLNNARVRQIMDRIGWREHFGLPLNLLFLATLLHYDPDCVKENTTQTSLYVTMHEWCVEKLQYRLVEHPQSKDIDRISRKESISTVFDMICKIALAGLLDDRLSLSDTDMRQLRDCCRTENLPREEVLGAFFSLRQSIVRLVVQQKYYAPHKGLLEFYAAHYVVNHLVEDSSVGGIRRLLQNTSRKPIELEKFVNLLLHVAGLLCQPDIPLLPAAIQEVVDLLAETGVDDCNEWLSLLEDTEVNSNVLERVAEHITNNDSDEEDEDKEDEYGYYDDKVSIRDSTVNSAAALLPLIPRTKISIELQREGDVRELCRAAANHYCMTLVLLHHYKHYKQPPASDSVLRVMPRSHIGWFVGYLSADGIKLLQDSHRLYSLSLAVSSDSDAQTILSTLAAVRPSLPHLYCLCLHIPVKAVTADVFTRPLPDILYHKRIDDGKSPGVQLVFSGMEEQQLEKAAKIAAALQPSSKGYRYVAFIDCLIDAAMCRRLLNLLADGGVRATGVFVPHTIATTTQETAELNTLANTRNLGYVDIMGNDDMWWL